MYELKVSKGSGHNGANWILTISIPAHGIWPESFSVLRSFNTEQEAQEEQERMFRDLLTQMSVTPVV